MKKKSILGVVLSANDRSLLVGVEGAFVSVTRGREREREN